jgi:hypothetical protein
MPDSWVAVVYVPGHPDGRAEARLHIVGFPGPRDLARWIEICGSSVAVAGDSERVQTVVGADPRDRGHRRSLNNRSGSTNLAQELVQVASSDGLGRRPPRAAHEPAIGVAIANHPTETFRCPVRKGLRIRWIRRSERSSCRSPSASGLTGSVSYADHGLVRRWMVLAEGMAASRPEEPCGCAPDGGGSSRR